jgi:hypothetical protein
MADWRDTRLWRSTLGERPNDAHAKPREQLRSAYEHFHNRAETLAAEIARDLPAFTVHDITHLDALWEMADLLLAEQDELSPAEAFVFGASVLTHDLGLGLAAYSHGIDDLKQTPLWTSAVHSHLFRVLGRGPTRAELNDPPSDVVKAVTVELLRDNHARQAAKLPLVAWGENPEYYLIDDVDLRVTYGTLVGQLASSHWFDAEELPGRFTAVLGAAPAFPKSWTVDPLRVACLLRTADLAHLDARRAPGFLRALRDIKGIAERHWRFQEHLSQPRREDDRLIYTAPRPFKLDEAAAWWLCFDTLSSLDRELRGVDALLADEGRRRFAARSVAKVERPSRLIDVIPTEGWLPIDARPKISDVVGLIERIGGEELYGSSPLVSLRELVENAADAVRARRAMTASQRSRPGAATYHGAVWVAAKKIGESWELHVSDNGVGMDVNVMTGPLLDFGASYWSSSEMTAELPELAGSTFAPTGKYGIGFYSVFMLGQSVSVTSRRFDASVADTHILQFDDGLRSRPILRAAASPEQMPDGGTSVHVRLGGSLVGSLEDLLAYGRLGGDWTLKDLCQWLFPALDVDVYTAEGDDEYQLSVEADDWLRISAADLLRRAALDEYPFRLPEQETSLRRTSELITAITDEAGVTVARIAIAPGFKHPRFRYMDILDLGVVTIGGARAEMSTRHIAGTMLGRSARVARDFATPVLSTQALAQWATEQARRLGPYCDDAAHEAHVAQTIIACNGDSGQLKVGQVATGWLTMSEMVEWARDRSEFLLLSAMDLDAQVRDAGEPQLADGVIVLELLGGGVISGFSSRATIGDWPRPLDPDKRRYYKYLGPSSAAGAFVCAVAKVWGVEWRPLLDTLNDGLTDNSVHVIGTSLKGESVELAATHIVRT